MKDKLLDVAYSQEDVKRFYSKVDFSSDCWNWLASKTTKGYGQFSFKSRMYQSHRVSFYFKYGFVDEVILHKCDNPSCVRPTHLRAGTILENNKDRDLKGRQVSGNSLKTMCKHGHSFDDDNTYVRPNGKRECITCKRNQLNKFRRK